MAATKVPLLIQNALADIFPLMSDDEFEALKSDMKAHGQREPIVLHEGRIVDGRNRYRACQELKLVPNTRDWDGVGSLVSFIISSNLHRRHLTSSQRAAVALEIEPMLAAEAKVRQEQHGGTAPGKKHLGKELPKCSDDGKAAEQAAKLTGTNRQYVADAKKLRDEAPEQFALVKAGLATIPTAKRAVAKRQPKNGKPSMATKLRSKPAACRAIVETLDEIGDAITTARKTIEASGGDFSTHRFDIDEQVKRLKLARSLVSQVRSSIKGE